MDQPRSRATRGVRTPFRRCCMSSRWFAVLLAALIVVPARAQLAGSWDVVPSPSAGPMASGNQLLDIVSLSPHDAWAVGVKPKSAGSALTAPLALRWDGTAWAIVDTPAIVATKSTLNSVAAAGADDVWAVG